MYVTSSPRVQSAGSVPPAAHLPECTSRAHAPPTGRAGRLLSQGDAPWRARLSRRPNPALSRMRLPASSMSGNPRRARTLRRRWSRSNAARPRLTPVDILNAASRASRETKCVGGR